MRALVTGCAGFIGSQVTEALLQRGDEVVGVDCFNDNYGRPQKLRNLRHFYDWDGFEFVPIDLGRGDLEQITDDRDAVIHLAAEPGVRSSWGERYERYVHNNVIATQHLLEALKDRDDVRLVNASSSSVYGDAEQRPTPETAPVQPLSPYGQTKLAAEHLCSLYVANYGLDAVSLRYFTVFGPRQRPDMAFHIFCRAALEKRPITVFGDGRQTRDFSYVGDVVAATLAAADRPLDEARVFNIGGGTPASIREVLEMIEQLAGHPVEVEYLDKERGDVRDTAADTTLAREHLGFEPGTSLEQGLGAEFEWLADAVADGRSKPRTAQ
ncbi:MAG TPA: NAD-dependent epimerase/dehydratase family protein [Solirubrobacterales bacterium]|nr:NAD-dependent epimerase/dehydratase family protein [Solirubrobacterales bacterium]